MTKDEMTALVKEELHIDDYDHDGVISDVIQDAMNYCNLQDIPEAMLPYFKGKVKRLMDYEAAQGGGFSLPVSSIKEGDGQITYAGADSGDNTWAGVHGINANDRRQLRLFRKLR